MNPAIQEQFQKTSTAQLQFAVDAMDGRPEVTDIWIHTTFIDGFLTGSVVYGVEGHLPVEDYYLDTVLKEPVGSTTREWQMILAEGVADAAVELREAYRETGEEHPSRIVVHYDVRKSAMDASFSYNKLDEKRLDPVPIFEKWFENARATGDFSADATTIPA